MSQANTMERILYTAIRLGEYQKPVSKEYVEYLKSVFDPKPEHVQNKPRRKIISIAPDGTKKHYKSIAECARQTGLTDGVIKNYVNLGTPRKIKDKYRGWRFEEDEDDNV